MQWNDDSEFLTPLKIRPAAAHISPFTDKQHLAMTGGRKSDIVEESQQDYASDDIEIKL